jgi:hypothetical protein
MHIAVAVALEGDLLMAPAILNADELPIADRAVARKDVIARAVVVKLSTIFFAIIPFIPVRGMIFSSLAGVSDTKLSVIEFAPLDLSD